MAKQILLSQGKTALVDDSDYEWLSQKKWSISSAGYAKRATRQVGKEKTIYMHREITGAPKGMHVDHIDGNPLNNTRSNLRIVTAQQNIWNNRSLRPKRGKYKGISLDKRTNLWVAQAWHNGTHQYLGEHKTQEQAARAYNDFVIKYRGEYARLNVLP